MSSHEDIKSGHGKVSRRGESEKEAKERNMSEIEVVRTPLKLVG